MDLILSLLNNIEENKDKVSFEYQQFVYKFLYGNQCDFIFKNEYDIIIVDEEEWEFYGKKCQNIVNGVLTKGFVQTQ